MNRENQDRVALIDRMLEARSEQELGTAEKDAEGWLKASPDDFRVVAASARLAKIGAKMQDLEYRANRLSASTFVVMQAAGGYLCAALVKVLTTLPLTIFSGYCSKTIASTLREET